MISVHHVGLHDVPQGSFSAKGLHDFLIPLFLAFGKTHLLLCHHLHGFAFVCQIGRLDRIIPGKALCQLLRALPGRFHVQRSAEHISPRKCAASGLSAQLCKFAVQLHCLVRVHFVFHIGPGGCPCVGAIDSIGSVHHGVNGIGVEHQRDRTILGVTFLCLDHRNRRRRQPAQLQRFPQISFSQVVDGHKVLLAVHLHRCAHLEPHRFLHRFVGSLAFGGILCYTRFRKQLRGFTALLGLEYRGKAVFFFCYFSVFNGEQTSIRTTHFMYVELACSIGHRVLVHDHCFIDFRFSHHNRSDEGIGIVASSLPIFHEPDLLTVFDNLRNCRCCDLLCWAIAVLHRRLCAFPGQFYRAKSGPFHFAADGFKEAHDIFCVFFVIRTVLDFCSADCGNGLHLFKLIKVLVQLLLKRLFALLKLEPHPLLSRRALGLESCGVFFCCPQGVHGLFGVGEVFVLQGSSLGLGQPLCLQGGGIAGVDGQHFLGPADDVAQQILHPVHHLVDGTPHARIFLGLSALEFHPALEVRFRRKDPPPRICHQLFGCLFVGKLLAGVHVHLVPDHLVYALISVHLGKVGQGMVLQALCSRLVEGVIPVVVLVQHGAENVADAVPEENTGRLAVHIGPDVRIVLQHVLQHSVGAGGGGVQLDDLAAHVGAVVIQRPFIVDPPLSARALVGQAAAVATRLFLGICTVEVGGIQRDPPALAAVQNIIDVQGSIVHHTGQPQRVVEALHLVHLRQMVDR